MRPFCKRISWDHLPVARPVAEAAEQQQLVEPKPAGQDDDVEPEIGCYGSTLLWAASLLSCCTITDWNKATKASMWRSRMTLMLVYMGVLVVTGIVMYAFYGGYEKLTILDDQGQRTLMVFGDGSLTEQLRWDPSERCGNGKEGLTRFLNDTRLGVFHGATGPEGCMRLAVEADADAVVMFEDVDGGAVMSVFRNSSNVVDFLCKDGVYAVRVMAALAGAPALQYNLTLQSEGSPDLRLQGSVPASATQTATLVTVAGGAGTLSAPTECAQLVVTSAPEGSIWELALPGSEPAAGTTVIASGRGGSAESSARLCLAARGGSYRVRLFSAGTGSSLIADPSASCQMEVRGSDGGVVSSFACGGTGAPQDVAVLTAAPNGAPLFEAAGGSDACSSLGVTAATGSSWWIISPTGQLIRGAAGSGTVRLCDTGMYEFGTDAPPSQGATTLQLGTLSTPLGPGRSSALFSVGTDAAFDNPASMCVDMALALDSPGGSSASWQLDAPRRFPQLLSGAGPWPLPTLSGDASTSGDEAGVVRRQVCQRGAYSLRVTGSDGFRLAFDGDVEFPRSCALSGCEYDGSCGGNEIADNAGGFLGSLQSAADSAWEGLGNDEGSLALRVTDDESGSTVAVCGLSRTASEAATADAVYFAKPTANVGSAVLLPAGEEPDPALFSAQARQAAASAREEVNMFCRPVACQSTPPPAPSPPPPPPGSPEPEPLDSSLIDLASGGSSRQCYPLLCTATEGDVVGVPVEYSCWEATSEATGVMAVMTLVAFILCPVTWFVIKLMGIKAEAHLNEQKEMEEDGLGMCLFPCCFCMSFCGCTCGVGTLKVIKWAFTFGANAVLAINLSFAYDAANDQYIADLFAATTWLAYMTIAFMLVNICWGLCNVRDLCKSRKQLREEDQKFASPEGWTPSMCCQLILGVFVCGAVFVGIFVWGAGAWSEYGHYSDDIAEMLSGLDGATVLAVLKRLAMGIALIHPNLLQIPDLTPIPLQISLALTICIGPVLFVVDLVSQLPWKLLAGCMSLKMRAGKVAALPPPGAGGAPSRSDAAQALSDTQARAGDKLDAKDESARQKQKDGKGLDDRLEAGWEGLQGRVDQVTGATDRVAAFVEGGVQGMVEESTAVEILDAPLQYGEDAAVGAAKAKAEGWAEEQTLGKLDAGDEVTEKAARSARSSKKAWDQRRDVV